MKKHLYSLLALVFVFTAFASVAWFVQYYQDRGGQGGAPTDYFPTKEPETGSITLKLGEKGIFRNISITPLEVVEDSRCAIDVICMWAGTTKVKLQIESGLGVSTPTIELSKSITTEAEEVLFVSVSPSRMESEPTKPEDYKFVFEVKKRVSGTPTPIAKKCFVGGCSSQICSDNPDVVSTCEFRAEYACYASAKCEVQPTGECGWTETQGLKMCLKNPPALE